MNGLFITGTDTGVGKTWVTLALMQAYANQGMQVAGMKPVASGGHYQDDLLVNDDALALQRATTTRQPYAAINPYVFLPPIAPHIAARQAGIEISAAELVTAFQALARQHDMVIVEGVGGWRVPLGEALTTTDLVARLQLPVILVTGFRLGCINHALLTAETIRRDGQTLAGWVASHIDPEYAQPEQTLETLNRELQAPLLGQLPFSNECNAKCLARGLDIGRIATAPVA